MSYQRDTCSSRIATRPIKSKVVYVCSVVCGRHIIDKVRRFNVVRAKVDREAFDAVLRYRRHFSRASPIA